MKLGYVLISVLFISFGLSWLPAQAGQDDSVRIRGPIGTDEAEIQQNAEVYGPVTRSDTLWGIATQVRPDTNVTLAQVMIALLHANPHAFLDNNPNALESGFMLRIPGEEEIRAVDAETARRQIEEGAPAQPRSARQPAANNAQNAMGQPAQVQAGQPERTQQASPSLTVQPVTEDRPPQGTTVAATGEQSDVNDIDAL